MNTIFITAWLLAGFWMLSVGTELSKTGVAARFASIISFVLLTITAGVLFTTGHLHVI